MEQAEARLTDLSQVQVEAILFGLNQEAERVRKSLYQRAEESGRKRSEYKGLKARRHLEIKARWPATEKMLASSIEAKVDADEEVATARQESYIAEALNDATIEEARLLKAQMSSMQSVLADLRPMVSER